jgi:hypothetical protein
MRAAVIGVFSISAWGSLLLCSVADSSSSSSSVSRNKAVTRRRQSTLFGVRSSLITAVDSNNNDCRVPSLKSKAFANDLPSLRTVTSRVLLNVRGGDEEEDEEYDDDDSEEEEYDVYDDESEEEEDDEEDMFSNFDLDGDDSDDFKEDKTFDRIAEAYHIFRGDRFRCSSY